MSNSIKGTRTKGGSLISQIHQVCGRVWNALLRQNGLDDMAGARGRVLFALWNNDHVPAKILCDKTSLDKSTMTGILDRLERDGYIVREQDSHDKRIQIVCRTGKDNFFADKVPDISDQMNEIFYRGFSPTEIAQFDNLLERILQNCKNAEGTL